MTSFILIRHAESPWSDDDDRPLSAAGLTAAESLPERLAAFSIDAIYSSPYRRSMQTIVPLARRRGLEVCEVFELRERTLGAYRCASFAEAMEASWSDFDLIHPGGESSRAAQARVRDLVDRLTQRHSSQTVVLATHGNLLALLLNGFDSRVEFGFWNSLAFPDVFELQVRQSGAGVFRRIE
jgi:2,3-bisphosphoglycerate-dependent phosphoglycerate mutase